MNEPYASSRLNRRQLIQVGSAGLFGLTLPRLLQADSTSSPATARSCIFIVLSGGLSHIDTWDPRPDAAEEIRGPYKPIATATPGVFLTDMFPELAKRTDQYCLVRSMSHGDAVHVTATHTMLSGQPDGTPNNDSPFIGSLVSKFRPTDANMPSHVWLHNMKTGTNKVPHYNSGLSKIGQAHAPVRIGYELDNPAAPDFRVRDFDPPEGSIGSGCNSGWSCSGTSNPRVCQSRRRRSASRIRRFTSGLAIWSRGRMLVKRLTCGLNRMACATNMAGIRWGNTR